MATRIPSFTLFTNDTYPLLKFTVNKSDGTGVQDLTGTSISCLLRLQGKDTLLFTAAQSVCQVTSASTGKVQYELPSAISDPGIYTGQLLIDFGSANKQRTQRFELKVLEGLPNPA